MDKKIPPGPYPSAIEANRHYLVGFLNYLLKHGPQQRIEVDLVDEQWSLDYDCDKALGFQVVGDRVEAQLRHGPTDQLFWMPISHFYIWDRMITDESTPDAHSQDVYETQNIIAVHGPL